MTSDPSTSPSLADVLGETFSMICFMAVYGPPVVFVAAPWLFVALLLSGPFVVVLTVVLALLVAAVVVAALGTLAMVPYLIVRRMRVPRASVARTPAPVELRGVTA